jgi:hypothetical protein
MKTKSTLLALLIIIPAMVFAEGGNIVFNALPTWIWLALLGIVEIALRLLPSSRPYYTILGAAKYILDLIIPDNTDEVKNESVISPVTKKIIETKKVRKTWGIFKK